jgi:hypothetical protein
VSVGARVLDHLLVDNDVVAAPPHHDTPTAPCPWRARGRP